VGDRAAAARTARRAAELGGGPLASLTAQRTAAGTPEAARVSEELLARARSAEEPALQRDLYEELSAFDQSQTSCRHSGTSSTPLRAPRETTISNPSR
jgi:hypothetical protein